MSYFRRGMGDPGDIAVISPGAVVAVTPPPPAAPHDDFGRPITAAEAAALYAPPAPAAVAPGNTMRNILIAGAALAAYLLFIRRK